MDVKLIAVTSKGTRKVIPLSGAVTTLGRQPDCDLQIQLVEVSRRHCEFRTNGAKIHIKDLDSANGTFVNGQKVSQQELKAGDIISLADAVRFCVQIDGEPQEVNESDLTRTPAAKKPAPKPAAAKPAPAKSPAPKPAKPAPSLSPAAKGKEDDTDADEILGESFFMDMDEDEEEESK
jgi:pSer/pThr/pTyr-binding forkhead associated (FHA) protein